MDGWMDGWMEGREGGECTTLQQMNIMIVLFNKD
jgi:hypothetical protein